ncbi:MAG: hypothetical protein IT443_06830 [Phycisphaeraceae bacterium]|nr:hypothetical protein [Phycisphaeraceae bacterium]
MKRALAEARKMPPPHEAGYIRAIPGAGVLPGGGRWWGFVVGGTSLLVNWLSS